MNEGLRWLSPTELRAWRGLMRVSDLLSSRTARTLQREFGLSCPDYTVLAELTRVPDARMRIQELAKVLAWEKSRVSHQLGRMAGRGLVQREDCVDDRRGAFVVVTPAGHEAIREAAPRHLQDVRALFMDHLSGDQIALVAEITELIIGKIDAGDGTLPGAAERAPVHRSTAP
ncbi:MarR family winged helix-turn-helix transcriptional regulator [Streptomyces sp. NPDC101149]|uniref:MarR family winged helix-turn-helix transcriptional regulator n=1 Tax=Streptomyces sp. NPDC101149 TaxID=3366113 RepID=UPI0037F9DC1C